MSAMRSLQFETKEEKNAKDYKTELAISKEELRIRIMDATALDKVRSLVPFMDKSELLDYLAEARKFRGDISDLLVILLASICEKFQKLPVEVGHNHLHFITQNLDDSQSELYRLFINLITASGMSLDFPDPKTLQTPLDAALQFDKPSFANLLIASIAPASEMKKSVYEAKKSRFGFLCKRTKAEEKENLRPTEIQALPPKSKCC